ncbi:hypothetical protein [Actinoalloteichus sp. AHMU CJ021]|uniref:hypothetical protein n=1 Tax=Actinoalloteichus sp. AHMU CJ021 TaxID=2072503 RepID=UPI00307BBE71
MTCLSDGLDHAVTDQEYAQGRQAGSYTAVCGVTLLAAPLISPPLPLCGRCLNTVRAARSAARPPSPPRRGPLGWLRGWTRDGGRRG